MLAWQAYRRLFPHSPTTCCTLSALRPVGVHQIMHHSSMSFEDAIATLNGHLEAPRPRPAQELSIDDKKKARKARFQLLFEFIEALELEDSLSKLKVIHVAGTKGKGSTCAFTESILRSCGYRTGLFTSPHLLDVRERFRFNGDLVSEDIFAKHFWWCWSRVQDLERESATKPFFFPFLTFLALKMFTEENVDVAILEVGLGGRYDATNVIQNPVVCGITSLGFDHMDVLGSTLEEIAFEKAGIFKAGVPAFSVVQEPVAMKVLYKEASSLCAPFKIAPALESYQTQPIHLGLDGEHQRINAALALSLCATFEKKTQKSPRLSILEQQDKIPDAYLHGLATASWPGRGQVIRDVSFRNLDKSCESKSGTLTFYLDGAHTPESLDVCASWYFSAISRENKVDDICKNFGRVSANGNGYKYACGNGISISPNSQRILLFNCMPKRSPELLLRSFLRKCQRSGTHINFAIFVPQFSSTLSIDTRSVSDIYINSLKKEPDLSWQKVLQQTWESLRKEHSEGLYDQVGLIKGVEKTTFGPEYEKCIVGTSSIVMPSLPAALKFLESWATTYHHVELQVLVTGSLYLVGDVLKICKENLDCDTPATLQNCQEVNK